MLITPLNEFLLGPRTKPESVTKICEILNRRPVEVLKGVVRGYDLVFQTIKPACPIQECERTGAGKFDMQDAIHDEASLRKFLQVPFERLLTECKLICTRPNAEEIVYVDVSALRPGAISVLSKYVLRGARGEVFHKQHFDSAMKQF